MSGAIPFPILPAPKSRPGLGAVLKLLAIAPPAIFILSWFGFVFWVLTGNTIIPVHWEYTNPIVIFVTGILLFMFVLPAPLLALHNLGRRLQKKDAWAVMREDPRPPVFFLRSFRDDPILDASLVNYLPHRLENTLTPVLGKLGPVIAIGKPGEKYPELGAARFYVADEHWQQAALYFMDHAAVVVILIGKTEGVQWEIRTALERVPPERLLLGFPYIHPDRRTSHQFLRQINNSRGGYSKSVLEKMEQERDQRYRVFREQFAGDLLASRLPETLGFNVFVDFDKAGLPRLLKTRRHMSKVGSSDPRQSLFQPDYKRTLRPFLEKMLGCRIHPSLLEWLYTTRSGLIITAIIYLFAWLLALCLAWIFDAGCMIPIFCMGLLTMVGILRGMVQIWRVENTK